MTTLVVPQEIVDRMIELREADDGESHMRQLGISYNTWRKITQGRSIRRSVAERIIARFDDGQHYDDADIAIR